MISLLDALLSMYFGFGIGMCMKILRDNKILYRGFLVEKDFHELNQFQYILFVFIFCFLWPARFIPAIKVAFKVADKETGRVLPL
jgi:hypothetical protein